MQNRLYKELCSLEVLKRAWHLARNDGKKSFIRDSFRYSDFGFNLDENLLRIQDSLKRECYYPKPLLEIDVPKSSLTVRPGSVPEIEDRIVTFAIVYLIAPRLDKKLPEGVYSYRLKPQSRRDQLFRDHEILKFPFLKKKTISQRIDIIEPWYEQWPAFMEKSIYAFEEEGFRFLATLDIVSYFENISLEILRDEIFLKFLPEEQKIINLLLHILEYWTWRSCEGRPVLRGIPQGNEVSSFLGNIYLLPLDDEFKKYSKNKDIKYFRYMDDVKIFTKDKATAIDCIFIMNRVLRRLHLNIQGEKTKIFEGEEIKKEIEDPRLAEVDSAIKEFEGRKLNDQERLKYLQILRQQYKKIKTRKQPILDKNLRLFRRLITGFSLLESPYLLSRALKELEKNPDNRLMESVVRYFRLFPKRKTIRTKLLDFLDSPLNKFDSQEAHVLIALRYSRIYPSKLIHFAKKGGRNLRKHWYVRCQAILILSQLMLSATELRSLLRHYKAEQNTEVKKALIKCLCQLKKDEFENFTHEAIFETDLKIQRIIKMLKCLKDSKDKAIGELNSLFSDFHEDRLIDELYKIEVIKFSNNKELVKHLLKCLKHIRRNVRRPILYARIGKIVKYIENENHQAA